MLERLRSTVETFVIPPFLAAERIDASAPNAKMPRKTMPLDVPTREPTGFAVAATGSVIEHAERLAITATLAANMTIFFMKLSKKLMNDCAYSIVTFRHPSRF
jgi:hypothetical protein